MSTDEVAETAEESPEAPAKPALKDVANQALNTAGRPFTRFASAWDGQSAKRSTARCPENRDAMREANTAHRDAMRDVRRDQKLFETARSEVKWWNVFNGERRAARAVVKDSRAIAREVRAERDAARKAYPVSMLGMATRCHAAHLVPTTAWAAISSSYAPTGAFSMSVAAVAANAVAVALGRRTLRNTATTVAEEDLCLSQEEAELLQRLDPEAWHSFAAMRGLSDVVALGTESTPTGLQTKLELNGQMTLEKLKEMEPLARAALRLKEGTRLELRPGAEGGRARMTLRTRNAVAEDTLLEGWQPGDPWGVNLRTGEPVYTPLGRRMLVAGMSGAGKALALDTRVPTPDGFKNMGDLTEGDTVFGLDGKPCTVTHAFDVRYGRPCYEVIFSDGTSVVADAEHQWATSGHLDRNAQKGDVAARRKRMQVHTTEEIRDSLVYGLGTTRESLNHAVPVAGAMDLPDADLMIPPYTLGAWLGDGTAREGRITNADFEVIQGVKADGYDIRPTPYDKIRGLAYRVPGLHTQLESLGVRNNKHIPTAYLRASESQRRALLAGLLDTDGSCTKSGSVEFYNKNERLIREVFHLIASLGYKPSLRRKTARLYGKDCGDAWTVSFSTADHVFTVARQNDRLTDQPRVTNGRRYITGLRPVDSVPVRCISVDSDDHLFLVTEACIATHNSWSMRPVLAEASAYDDHALVVIDLKKFEANNWSHRARVAKTMDEVLEVTEELIAEMEERADLTPRGEDTFQVTVRRPRITVFVDEGAEVIARAEGRNAKKEHTVVMDYLRSLAAMGRASEIIILWATQKPTLTGNGRGLDTMISAQISCRASMAVSTSTESRVIFGDDATAKGWDAHELPMPGVAMLRDGHKAKPDHIRTRAFSPKDVIALPDRKTWSRQVSSTGASASDIRARKAAEASSDPWAPHDIAGEDVTVMDVDTMDMNTSSRTVPSRVDRDDQVMAQLAASPGNTMTALARKLGLSPSSVKASLERMRVDGLVVRDDAGYWAPADGS